MKILISIDPGKEKCGIILANKDLGVVLDGKVVHRNSVIELINLWRENYLVDLIVMGNGTTSSFWKSNIQEKVSTSIILFDEKNTTLRARNRYWELWEKNIFLKLIPNGLIIPNENLDAIAALILLEDYLKIKLKWAEKPNFKIWP
tara:strand:- start:1451 stop:1888 length:438 start_codon:yes stop_codon:yes gene_type:complete